MVKRVYYFSPAGSDGDRTMKNLLGGKGSNLAEMAKIGLPIPPGFTITTNTCMDFQKTKSLPDGLMEEITSQLATLEKEMGQEFGRGDNPLLLSIRSGARESMPGMMDTILNCGLNDHTAAVLAKQSGNPQFAYDSYRRLIQMYSDVVLELDGELFEHALEHKKQAVGAANDNDLTGADLQDLIKTYKEIVLKASGKPFPDDPMTQLTQSIEAVFNSWNNDRAILYRDMNNIDHNWGTAVTVMAMVFGNMGTTSCTGVAFTRDPSTGENYFYGEFLQNAQGEDVVAGIRTPLPLMAERDTEGTGSMETIVPESFKELCVIRDTLEHHYKDMQDIEFTVQKGRLFMLQTRTGKRTAAASVRMATEMLEEGLIAEKEAVLRVTPEQVESLLHPQLDSSKKTAVIATGLPASPGGATGIVALDTETATAYHEAGKQVMLVRIETSPEDLKGMTMSEGILTARGGMTSHAAVVTRQMGKPCVSAVGTLSVDMATRTLTIGDLAFKEGDLLTIDGSTGEVFVGDIPRIVSTNNKYFTHMLALADKYRTLGVWANADKPVDAQRARDLGAEGIGLTRTEHMFFEGERIWRMREVILSKNEDGRRSALSSMEGYQQSDFEGLFKAMDGLPVTVRLLDPPLHEFLPEGEEDIASMASHMGVSVADVHEAVESLHEVNPMLGHRGCRLGVTMPELYEMQATAIVKAVIAASAAGIKVTPKIMIPLVSQETEIIAMKQLVADVIEAHRSQLPVDVAIGTMIELPRACLISADIAKHAEFFSFGTNDLTQTTFGLSRDDSANFLPDYQKAKMLKHDPFAVLDGQGVGQLIKLACQGGRTTNPALSIGICGEHGGDPESIMFIHSTGMVDYVSCSPLRVPVARMAAAHAAIKLGVINVTHTKAHSKL